jgi:isoquinoline 1-oxidoreductase subunit beta
MPSPLPLHSQRRSTVGKWTRRTIIGVGGLVGGGLVLGVGAALFAPNRLRIVPRREGGRWPLTTWVRVTPANEVVAIIPHCEMGQGALNGVAMMLAEELEADWGTVRIEEAPPELIYANGYMLRGFAEEGGASFPGWLARGVDYASYRVSRFVGLQVTGGSSSIRSTGRFGMLVAGATAKAMLLEAAAASLDAPLESCVAKDSHIVHVPSGQRVRFADVADAASRLPPPRSVSLKSPADYSIIGTSKPRADIPSKVDGTAVYGIDVTLPDMRYAAVAGAPVPGATLVSVDSSLALTLPGVEDVIDLPDAVAVVASGYWQAEQALRALEPKFDDMGKATVSSNDIFGAHGAALDADRDLRRTLAATGDFFLAEYRVPYLAHATMEPMSATARFADGRCEVWAGTQDPLSARLVAAEAAELDFDDVELHNMPLGGGFGRRLPGAFDYIEQAVRIAKRLSPHPVKLIWSREQDMQHDYYRPAVVARLGSVLDENRRPQSWVSQFTGRSFLDRMAATPPYRVADTDIRVVEPFQHLREGSWRSVESSQHGFFMESYIDELAHNADEDPYRFRRELLAGRDRHRAVLDRAAEMADWGRALPPARAHGIALVESFGTIVAEVAEVSVDDNGTIRVHRVDAAIDCGRVINPDQAQAQIQGGIVFGLSAALFQKITVRDGRVEQRNFPGYPMIRLANAPRIKTSFIESGATLGGLGEPGVPPIAPAVANAVYAITGKRLRILPLSLEDVAQRACRLKRAL